MQCILDFVKPILENPKPKQKPNHEHHQNQACAQHAHSASTTHLLLLKSLHKKEDNFLLLWAVSGDSFLFYLGIWFRVIIKTKKEIYGVLKERGGFWIWEKNVEWRGKRGIWTSWKYLDVRGIEIEYVGFGLKGKQ